MYLIRHCERAEEGKKQGEQKADKRLTVIKGTDIC